MRQYPTPEKLFRAQTGKLTEVLQTARNGRFGEWKATQLKELAKDSFGIPDCEGVYSALLLLYLRRFQSLQDAAAVLFRAYYEKKAVEGLRCMNIIGHVSKKMTSAIFAVMRDNKLYEPVLPVA